MAYLSTSGILSSGHCNPTNKHLTNKRKQIVFTVGSTNCTTYMPWSLVDLVMFELGVNENEF